LTPPFLHFFFFSLSIFERCIIFFVRCLIRCRLSHTVFARFYFDAAQRVIFAAVTPAALVMLSAARRSARTHDITIRA